MLGTCSLAQANESAYLGFSYGNTEFESDDITPITAQMDSSDSGLKLFFGYDLSRRVSLEFAYVDFGESSLSGSSGDTFMFDGSTYAFIHDTNWSAEVSAITVSTLYSFRPGNTGLAIQPRLGLAMWESESNYSNTIGTYSVNDDGANLFYGIGLMYKLTKLFSLKAEYKLYNFDSDVEMLGIGLKMHLH